MHNGKNVDRAKKSVQCCTMTFANSGKRWFKEMNERLYIWAGLVDGV